MARVDRTVRPEEARVSEARRGRGIFLFVLKFFLLAPVILYLWWAYLLPPYSWILGQTSGLLINLFSDHSIEAMRVEADDRGILNTLSLLVFIEDGQSRPFPVSFLVDSFPPFVILVLATAGLSLLRRSLILLGGSLILFVGNAIYIAVVYIHAQSISRAPEIGNAVGQFWLTLPFVLWILLAYWDRIGTYFQEEPATETMPTPREGERPREPHFTGSPHTKQKDTKS